MKKKKVLWAIINVKSNKIENESTFSNTYGCCCADEPEALAIYNKKNVAIENIKYSYDEERYSLVKLEVVIPKVK